MEIVEEIFDDFYRDEQGNVQERADIELSKLDIHQINVDTWVDVLL